MTTANIISIPENDMQMIPLNYVQNIKIYQMSKKVFRNLIYNRKIYIICLRYSNFI